MSLARGRLQRILDRINSLVGPKSWSYTSVVNYLVHLVAVLVPVLLVGIPIGFFIWGAFWSTTPGLSGGHFSLEGYRQLLEIPYFWSMVWNTSVVIVFGTAIAMAIGIFTALLTNKFDVPGTSILSYVVILQYVLPSLILALGWSLLTGSQGFLNQLLIRAGLAEGQSVYFHNEWGIAVVVGFHYAGLVYLLINGAIASVPLSMEESARVSGASKYQVLRYITLSLSTPSIIIAMILVAALNAQNFAAPLLIGLPNNVFVFSTFIFFNVARFPTDFGVASALGTILMALVILALVGQWYLKGQSEAYQTLVGKGTEERQVRLDLSPRTKALAVAALVFIVGFIALPLAWVFVNSFLTRAVGVFSPSTEWTLANYTTIFFGQRSVEFWPAVVNTLFISVVGSFLTMVLATLMSYVIIKGKSSISSLLDIIALAPISIPLIIIGVSYLWFFLNYNVLGLYGTIWLLIIAIAASEIIYGTRAVNSSLQSIGDNLEEAAQLSGANVITILRKIYFPLIKPGFFAGYFIAFIHYFKSFTRPILLRDSDTHVLSTLMEALFSSGWISQSVAVASVMGFIIVVLLALTEFFTDFSVREFS